MDNEQRQSLFRSIVPLVVSLLVIAAITWAIFFRNNGDKQNDSSKTLTTGAHSQKQSEKTVPGQAAGDVTKTVKNPEKNTNSPTPPQPTQLANVGPGNMSVLFAGAVVAGAGAHALVAAGLRRRVSSRKLGASLFR
ncbi:MAG TPA: hypothetical protein VF733_03000 [Candidatus Saccharimonadales bacterium]